MKAVLILPKQRPKILKLLLCPGTLQDRYKNTKHIYY